MQMILGAKINKNKNIINNIRKEILLLKLLIDKQEYNISKKEGKKKKKNIQIKKTSKRNYISIYFRNHISKKNYTNYILVISQIIFINITTE